MYVETKISYSLNESNIEVYSFKWFNFSSDNYMLFRYSFKPVLRGHLWNKEK